MNGLTGLPEETEDQGVRRVGPRELHVVGQPVGWDALQEQLACVGVLALVALEGHIEQAQPDDRGGEQDQREQN